MLLCAAAATVLLAGCADRGDSPTAGHYRTKSTADTLSTGRIYLGREIPRVRAHAEVADWLERPTRDQAEFPDRLVAALELRPADVVADIGAGTGFYTFRLAPLVPHGRVLAVDIQPEMLEMIRRRVAEDNVRNVQVIEGTVDDPKLPPSTVDVALIVGSYHEFYHPYEMMTRVVESLVPGGRVVLVEYRGEDETLPLLPIHRLTEAQAIREMEFVGLTWVTTRRDLPQQHFLVFRKPAA